LASKKNLSFDDQIQMEYDHLRCTDLSIQPQLESESRLSNKIGELHEQDWTELVSSQPARMTITSPPFMQCSWLNHDPEDAAADVGLVRPVTSMALDEATGLVWLNSSPLVRSFDLEGDADRTNGHHRD
jgi:hypothetical protein